jgi:hypothetical protein
MTARTAPARPLRPRAWTLSLTRGSQRPVAERVDEVKLRSEPAPTQVDDELLRRLREAGL